jgi:hypothetical protein
MKKNSFCPICLCGDNKENIKVCLKCQEELDKPQHMFNIGDVTDAFIKAEHARIRSEIKMASLKKIEIIN